MKFNLQSVPSQGESEFSGQKAAKTRAWLNSARQFAAFFFQLRLSKDWPRTRKSRTGAGEMFLEVNRGGALILPGAQGLVFISRRSRRCGAANQILASSSMLNPDSKREGASRRGRSGTPRVNLTKSKVVISQKAAKSRT